MIKEAININTVVLGRSVLMTLKGLNLLMSII